MAFDPNTGMWTPDEFRQPLGALGAVTNYLNARRAKAISDQEMASRQAQIDAETQRTDQASKDYEAENQMRAEIAALGPKATEEERIAVMSKYKPLATLPWLRAQTSAGAKVDAATIGAKGKTDVANIQAGVTGAPLPTAQANKANAQAGLATTTASDIVATRDARIEKLRADAIKAKNYVRGGLAKGAKFSPRTVSQIATSISALVARQQAIRNQKDPLTGLSKKLTAEDDADLKEIDVLIADAKESLEIAKRMAAGEPAATAPAAKSPEDEANAFLSGLNQ